MSKGTLLYVGNFELPDKGASANRVMTNRLLFQCCGYKTAYLGITREAQFDGVRQSSFDNDIYERAYPSSTKAWIKHTFSIEDIVKVAGFYDDIKAVIFYNTPVALVKKAHKFYANKNVKILYDCTEWNADAAGNIIKRLYKKYDLAEVIKKLEKYVDGMIPISTLMFDNYKKKPRLLLPPLVDVESALWQVKRTRHDGFEFCYAGDPEGKDNLCTLIKSFAELDYDNAILRIIGVNRIDFIERNKDCEDLLDTLKNRVLFMGRISHDKTIEYLINCDCFVFIRESNLRNNAGFPTKFAEAYTSGVQVIATDISDVGNYQNDNIYILKNTDEDKIAHQMRKAISNKMAFSLRKEFDFRAYTKQAAKFLSQVLD